jgi:hypothetical protein
MYLVLKLFGKRVITWCQIGQFRPYGWELAKLMTGVLQNKKW